MNIIRQGDLPLSQKLHDQNDHKPYTISLLQGGKRGRDGALHFGQGDTADWRFTLLCEPAFEALLRRYLLNRNLPHVRIGAVTFAIIDAFASGISHPDSGHISMSELTARWNVAPETLPCQICLDFRSPTAFSLGKDRETGQYRYCSLPDARTLFSTLRKRWSAIGGAEPGDLFDEWIAQHIEVEPRHLHTRNVLIEGRPIVGFVGHVCFHIRGSTRWLALVHLLSDLTYWTGVGYQTTRGMGQVRQLDL
jgi:CRISPR-associated endoribonuclease Cas6